MTTKKSIYTTVVVWLSGPEDYGKALDELEAHRDEIEIRANEMMNDIIKMKESTNQPKE